MRQGDCRQAIVEYQRMISLDPRGEGNDEAQFAVARCSFALGDYDQARAEYELLLERYPESALRRGRSRASPTPGTSPGASARP